MSQMPASRQLESMHYVGFGVGQPSSYRDASNLRSGPSKGPWQTDPTPIIVPSNRPPDERRKGSNPFSFQRMANTMDTRMSNPRKPGNRTARQTVLERKQQQQPKQSRYFPGTRKPDALQLTGNSADIIQVIDVDEDIGHRISEPRMAGSSTSLSRVTREVSPDPIDSIPAKNVVAQLREARPNWQLPDDGENTRLLMQKVNANKLPARSEHDEVHEIIQIDDNDGHESISDFSDEPSKNPDRSPEMGHVKRMALRFERKDIPHLDLIQTTSTKKKSGTVKGRMKGKAVKPQIQRLDPEATAPSGYTTSLTPASRSSPRKEERFELPLEAFTMGTSMYSGKGSDPAGWFCLEGQQLSIKEFPESSSAGHKKNYFSVRAASFIGDLQYTLPLPTAQIVILKFITRSASHRFPHKDFQGFTHRHKGQEGTMTFKFLTNHPRWDTGEYTGLIEVLKRESSTSGSLTQPNSQSCWEMAYRESEVSGEASDDSSASIKRRKSCNDQSKHISPPEIDSNSAQQGDQQIDSDARPKPRPRPAANAATYTPRRVTRASAVTSTRASPVADPDELILVYPPSGTGAINITNGDLKRLAPGQYLNDTLIEFALKLWLNELREHDAELAEQIHIFSSFFYKKIQVKNKEEGYSSVRKWTSKIDLFKKKYIIVPINEHLHWYLAIICNPEFVLQPPPPKALPAVQTRKRKRDSDAAEQDIPGNSPPPPDAVQDTASANAEDESNVEAMLTTCSISQTERSSESISPHTPEGGKSTPEVFELDLQYPTSEGSPYTEPADTATDALASGSVEPIDIDLDDDTAESTTSHVPMDVDSPSISRSSAIPCASFYGSSKGKGKQAAIELSPEVPCVNRSEAESSKDVPPLDLDNDAEEPSALEAVDFQPDKTYVFTFDSLGTKHPAAARNLSMYLQMEANDKKGLDTSHTTAATGVTALVPVQPNYCDCGVYLIHFVQTFMKHPEKFSETIVTKKARDYDLREREQDWNAEVIGSLREVLHAKALSLSEEWKKERSAREEQKKKKKDAAEAVNSMSTPAAEVIPDSEDDDIIVGEVITRAAAKKGAAGKGKQVAGKEAMISAMRLR